LVRHLTLLAPAQDFIQILPGIEQTVEIFVASRELGKATVVVGDEAGQKRICRLDRADACESRAVNLSLSSRASTSRRFSSRLLITTMPIEMTASELPERSRN
jgi:hypothetical protein